MGPILSRAATQDPAAVLLGSAHIKGGELIPTRLLSPDEVQGLVTQSTSGELQIAPQRRCHQTALA
jgi:hypothetical protein